MSDTDKHRTWDEMDQKLDITLLDENDKSGASVEVEHLLDTSVTDTRKKLSAKHRYTFRTTIGEDMKCRTSSIVCLDDDRIVISDIKWSQLKVFDKDYKFCFSEPCYPRAEVSHLSANEILLTSKDLKKVMFYAVEDRRITQLPKILDMKQEIYGCNHGNDHFGLLLESQWFYISVLNAAGNEVGKIQTVQGTDNPLSPCKYFTMHPTEKKVYIADQINNKIVCTTYSGEVLLKVVVKDAFYIPCEPILLETVIIVGLNNGYIVTIAPGTEEHHTIQSLVSKDKTNTIPRFLALQHKSGCIIVGSSTKDYCDVIRSFQIKWSE